MSAPGTDQSLSSISSSGQVDGLGRRVLAFDRETGAILERLYLRPEVATFESAIRERIDQLASLDDERFARPGSIERDPATGELTVLSEFVAGSRLSDLLETAEEGALVPGVDVALGFLLEALSAIAGFHAATGFAHGLIAPPRMVLTPAGQIVLLDPALGGVVERLGMSRARLWTQLEIAAPPGRGPVQLDASADVAQAALSAVMLVIGRRLREHEYPDALPSLVSEVVEVAQIRGSSLFASTLQRLLERALALGDPGPAVSADDLSHEIRLLLRREIGVEVCRQALIDFTEQMDAAFSTTRGEPDAEYLAPAVLDAGAGAVRPDLDLDRLTLEALDTLEVLDVEDSDSLEAGSEEDAEDEAFEEVPLDPEFVDEADLAPPPVREPEPEPTYFEDEPLADPEPPAGTPSAASSAEDEIAASPEPKEIADPWSFDPAAADRVLETGREEDPRFAEPAAIEPPAVDASDAVGSEPLASFDDAPSASLEPAPALADAPLTADGPAPPAADSPDAGANWPPDPEPLPALPPLEAEAPSEPALAPVDEAAPAAPDEPVPASPRRKKRQHKSARARKDKLRSAADAKAPAKAPESKPQGGWLVNPDRAAAFAPPVPELAAPQPPPVIGHSAPVPASIQAAAQAPAPVIVPPAAPAPPPAPIPMPVYGTPAVPAPAPAPAPPPPPAPAPTRALKPNAPGAPLRLKEQPPSGYARKRPSETFASGYVHRAPQAEPEPPRRFPWKLALALLVLVGAAIVVGRAYLPSKAVADDEGTAVEAGTAAPRKPAVVVMPKVETGHISIETQPAGARVLLDGKAVGESPLKLADVPVGRHTLTFVSSSGQVSRTVQVEPGRTAAVDVPIFSGWVAIYAPVVLDVAVNGRSIGTTERERLMLAPGRHELTLTNTELGYRTVQTVQVEPGQVRGVRLDPRGPVSFNATPWAEVWLAGKKLGETPLADVHVPIGIQEFVFKHPEYGERKVTATIRATGTEAVSVDFTGSTSGLESR